MSVFGVSRTDKTTPSWETELFGNYTPNSETTLDNLRTEYMKTPLGIDVDAPVFSWEMHSDVTGQKQTAYQIQVAEDKDFDTIVYDSGVVASDASMGVRYDGDALQPQTRYFWKVAAKDKDAETVVSDTTWFETGLMCTDQSNWPDDIAWIGNPNTAANNSGAYNQNAINNFTTQFKFSLSESNTKKFRAIVAARNKVTYAFAEIDLTGEPTLRLGEVTEGNAVKTQPWNITAAIPDTAAGKNDSYTCTVVVNGRTMSATIAGDSGNFATGNQSNFLSATPGTSPRRWYMGNFGFDTTGAVLTLESFRQYNGNTNYYTADFTNPTSQLSSMGTLSDGKLTLRNTFSERRAVQTTTLRKEFGVNLAKKIKSARMYITGRGIYDAYINGKSVTDSYFNPNFTEYDMRIMYQTYDVTDLLRAGKNAIGAYVSRGWYADYNGYSGSQRAGTAGDMMAFVEVEYADGTSEVVVKTDNTWKFNAASPSLNGSFMDGEIYDATLETPGWDKPNFDDTDWVAAGVKNAPNYTNRITFVNDNASANSYFASLNPTFQLSAQVGPLSNVERILPALNLDNPKVNDPGDTHFTAGGNQSPSGLSAYAYDLGQNIVGVPRITVKGARGTEIEITGAEIAFQDGTPYNDNYRTAYNTTSYTLKGDPNGETFSPKFTYNGFRYVIIRVADGHPSDVDIQNVEGIVLTNTDIATGDLNTSDGLVNQLQSNALWGQRGNYLMVPTDCPQRNERMGWTADTQVFSTTASYNVDTVAFLKKWLQDVRDAQVRYNRGGAVPDTAPLGGDNRGSQYGCSIWADAGVMIPWNLYIATGDVGFLSDNYDLMWDMTKYRAGRNTGYTNSITNTSGGTVGNADAWLVAQQRRGDHLAYDATTPFVLSGTAYAYYVCDLMNRTATLLGKDSDADDAATWADCFKKGFNEKYVFEDGSLHYWGETATGAYTMNMWHEKWGLGTGQQTPQGMTGATYVDFHGNYVRHTEYGEPEHNLTRVAVPEAEDGIAPPSETAYALAIAFGLLSDDQMEAAGDYLVKSIQSRATETQPDGALSVGFASVAWILPALSMTGHDDMAYSLLMNEGLPGWLYTVLQGGTTFWERWNSYTAETDTMGPVDMNSFNHYAYGAVGYWMYGYMMGLQLDEAQPGYKHVNIAPVAGGDMTYATTYHDSIFGRVESGWTAEDNEISSYSTVVPANTTATLYLPVDEDTAAGAATDVEIAPGVTYKGIDVFNARTVAKYDLQSGHYTFYRLDAMQEIYNGFKDLNAADYTAASWSPLAAWLTKYGAEIENAVQADLPYGPVTFTADSFTPALNGLQKRGLEVDVPQSPPPGPGDDMVNAGGTVTVTVGKDNIPVLSAAPSVTNKLDLAKIPASSLTIADKTWTGKQINGGLTVKLTYMLGDKLVTKMLSPKTDYTVGVPGANTNIGKGSITLYGKAGSIYAGTKSLTFKILPKAPTRAKLAVGKKNIKVSWKKASKAQVVTGYQVQYRYKSKSGASWSKWYSKSYNINYAKGATATKNIKNQKAKTDYKVRIRTFKTIKSGADKGKYYSAWSPTISNVTN
ncbi:MAG: glycoside hydrolase family 78 protein [Clostridiales Family XIII bacterium]|jgi:alpha-L-rhamnosidase|nr:glycoside hydrolase family 78 protein [Clostridiales Family XIII bacterium]